MVPSWAVSQSSPFPAEAKNPLLTGPGPQEEQHAYSTPGKVACSWVGSYPSQTLAFFQSQNVAQDLFLLTLIIFSPFYLQGPTVQICKWACDTLESSHTMKFNSTASNCHCHYWVPDPQSPVWPSVFLLQNAVNDVTITSRRNDVWIKWVQVLSTSLLQVCPWTSTSQKHSKSGSPQTCWIRICL